MCELYIHYSKSFEKTLLSKLCSLVLGLAPRNKFLVTALHNCIGQVNRVGAPPHNFAYGPPLTHATGLLRGHWRRWRWPTQESSPFTAAAYTAATSPAVEASGSGFNNIAFE